VRDMIGCAFFFLVEVSLPAFAQRDFTYDRWPEVYERYVKPLPPGFHDFIPHPRRSETALSSGIPLCRDWHLAISLGKRLGEGMSVSVR
jgi:hypothetical protein